MKANTKIKAATVTSLMELPLWNTEDLGRILNTPAETVRSWRRTGTGPKFIYLTKRAVRYKREDVMTWLSGNTRTSTSQSPEQAAEALAGAR